MVSARSSALDDQSRQFLAMSPVEKVMLRNQNRKSLLATVTAVAAVLTAVSGCSSNSTTDPAQSSAASGQALPVPAQIIILRHGEKKDGYALCNVGQQRAQALTANYLGRGAEESLFPSGAGPSGFFAITLHSLELASPAAQSWNLPLITYSVVPGDGQTKTQETQQLNQRTQQAAEEVLTDPRWGGKTVVMSWEHKHIANEKLEQEFSGTEVTLRQLLNLDKLSGVPTTWPGTNFDYFWIVDYGNPGSPIPTKFTSVRQVFPAPYQAVPSNLWDTPEALPAGNDCEAPSAG